MRRVCLFAQFDPRHRIPPHVVTYVGHLQRCGYHTVVACSGSRLPPKDDRDALTATGAAMVFRPNHGLDFGAWQQLIREGHTEGADTVLLANDSVFGPFSDLAPIIARMDAKGLDVWGMIESRQHRWHLQSWFLQFSARAFNADSVARLFQQPFATMSKHKIIENGELALGAALQDEGLRCGAVIGTRDATWLARRRPINQMHLDWRYNLTSGRLPFIKADLLRANLMNIPWAREWEGVVAKAFDVPTAEINARLFEYTGRVPDHPGQSYPVPTRKIDLDMLTFYALCSRDRGPAIRALMRGLKSALLKSDGRSAPAMHAG
ncbi:MAG: hypothetical protein H7Z10_12315 [Gemmatimonadaceae bacterium]|nr:hypothetical protein [Acetobacteraceae bacterium]